MGINGAGEIGIVAALPSITLAPLGIAHLDMPATPEKAWRAIRSARP